MGGAGSIRGAIDVRYSLVNLCVNLDQEAVNINLGLLSLRTCITALVEGDSHVPYGNSKLTQLLSGALGGNCRSLVLVTGSMERRCGRS